jgi:hypothetical protein
MNGTMHEANILTEASTRQISMHGVDAPMFAGHDKGGLALPIGEINAELLGLLRPVCHDCGL